MIDKLEEMILLSLHLRDQNDIDERSESLTLLLAETHPWKMNYYKSSAWLLQLASVRQ